MSLRLLCGGRIKIANYLGPTVFTDGELTNRNGLYYKMYQSVSFLYFPDNNSNFFSGSSDDSRRWNANGRTAVTPSLVAPNLHAGMTPPRLGTHACDTSGRQPTRDTGHTHARMCSTGWTETEGRLFTGGCHVTSTKQMPYKPPAWRLLEN